MKSRTVWLVSGAIVLALLFWSAHTVNLFEVLKRLHGVR